MSKIDRERIKKLIKIEESLYIKNRPKSQALFKKAQESLLKGVPMSWMHRWVGPFPIFVNEAVGNYLTDVDGHRYLDLCLGDSGAMFGHSPDIIMNIISDKIRKGITHMLPTEDSIWVSKDLTRRFNLPYWQIYMTASDANRFAIRIARQITKRTFILVFDGCYHGSVDETLVNYRRNRIMGIIPDISLTTKVIQFNDLNELGSALSSEDVACVICEPAMTDVGIIYPIPDYHKELRKVTRKYNTLLIIDETHTICAGPGGLTSLWNLQPDILTLGKPIASGIPIAVMGLSKEVKDKFFDSGLSREWDMGLGGTLSGNALAIAAMKATLKHLITESNYEHMINLAKKMYNDIQKIIKIKNLPWHVKRLGCRLEYRFKSTPPINGAEAIASNDPELDKLVHLYFTNRNILITPFHNMILTSPYTTIKDVNLHNKIFSEFIQELLN